MRVLGLLSLSTLRREYAKMNKTKIYLFSLIVFVTIFILSVTRIYDLLNNRHGRIYGNGMILQSVSDISIKANHIIQDMDISNDMSNEYAFSVFIVLNDDTVIYESGFVDPGVSMSEIYLYQSLNVGIYRDAKFLYKIYTSDSDRTFICQYEFTIDIYCFE